MIKPHSIKENLEAREKLITIAVDLSNFVEYSLAGYEKERGGRRAMCEIAIDGLVGYPFRLEIDTQTAFEYARQFLENVKKDIRFLDKFIAQQAKSITAWCYPEDSPEHQMGCTDGWGRPLEADANGKIIHHDFNEYGEIVE